MAYSRLRNETVQWVSLAAAVVTVVVGLVVVGWGLTILFPPNASIKGLLPLAGGTLIILYAILMHGVVSVILRADGNINRIHHDALDLVELLQRVEPMIQGISDNSEISEAARSITHREKEREALRQAIREEMYGGDWEAAHYLVDLMEHRFGYKQESQSLRTELSQIREMTIEEKIGEAVAHIEKIMVDHRWERARVETERLMKLFPKHERITSLPATLNRRREQRKQELVQHWNQAVQREEVDRAVEILTELDQYLTAEEGQSLRDSARHVFKAHLLNLGVQFGLAVSEGRWRAALETGLQIRQEFPNSRMAQEVTDKLDVLRVRAGFVSDAEITQRQTPATK